MIREIKYDKNKLYSYQDAKEINRIMRIITYNVYEPAYKGKAKRQESTQ